MKTTLVLLTLFSITLPNITSAHPGRTDSSGCHTCRTNCPNWGLSYGEYHCHQSKGVPQPIAPVRSIRSEQITVPAPEYAIPKRAVIIPTIKAKAPTVTTVNSKVPVVQIKPNKPVQSDDWMTSFFNFLFK